LRSEAGTFGSWHVRKPARSETGTFGSRHVRKPANEEFQFSEPEKAESVTQPLEERFPSELSVLSDLFGRERVVDALPRLNEIHDYTERKWRDFVARIPDGRVRYLLIAEAPPWSDRGAPQYVLDPGSRSRTLLRALRGAFLSSSESRHLEPGEVLTQLALRGLIVVDSIPFSMNFTGKRTLAKYEKLVRMTTRAYLMPKVQSASLSWPSDLRIAFGVKLNASAVMKALGNTLHLGDASHPLGPQMIAVNGAGYPDAKRLKAVYDF
jgi:hypothetical protein